MGSRAVSADPKQAVLYAREFLAGLKSAHVIGSAKHFPGLGAAATNQNTDQRPVTLNLTRYQIRHIDELPPRWQLTSFMWRPNRAATRSATY